MKICAACRKELPKDSFSKKQWIQKQYLRRCKGCVDDDAPLQLEPPDKPSCFICMDEGPDRLGNPLRRECSCRGESAGWSHLSCLVEYAKKKGGDTGVDYVVSFEMRLFYDESNKHRVLNVAFHVGLEGVPELSPEVNNFVSAARRKNSLTLYFIQVPREPGFRFGR